MWFYIPIFVRFARGAAHLTLAHYESCTFCDLRVVLILRFAHFVPKGNTGNPYPSIVYKIKIKFGLVCKKVFNKVVLKNISQGVLTKKLNNKFSYILTYDFYSILGNKSRNN